MKMREMASGVSSGPLKKWVRPKPRQIIEAMKKQADTQTSLYTGDIGRQQSTLLSSLQQPCTGRAVARAAVSRAAWQASPPERQVCHALQALGRDLERDAPRDPAAQRGTIEGLEEGKPEDGVGNLLWVGALRCQAGEWGEGVILWHAQLHCHLPCTGCLHDCPASPLALRPPLTEENHMDLRWASVRV